MIAIKERIVTIYNQNRYDKLLYQDRKWHTKPQNIYFVIFISLGISLFLYVGFNQPLLMLIWAIIFVLGFFTIINPILKKRRNAILKNKTENDSFEKHYCSTGLLEFQLKKIRQDMLKHMILKGNSRDIELLTMYEEFFEEEAKNFKSKEKFIVAIGTILLFALPVWHKIISLLITQTSGIESFKLVFELLFYICMLIYFLNLLKYWLDQYLNATYWKYINIKRVLHQIKLNLQLKQKVKTDSKSN